MKTLKLDRDWDTYFMSIAYVVSSRSTCLSRQIGSVVVKDRQILSTGYNGPPSGVKHCAERVKNGLVLNGIEIPDDWEKCPRLFLQNNGESYDHHIKNESQATIHLCPAAHSEANAVSLAARAGISVKGATIYCWCPLPCKACATSIINSGITEVVCKSLEEYDARQYAIKSLDLFSEAGVGVRVL